MNSMIADTLIPLLNESTSKLLRAMARFSPQEFNQSITPAWSAGQIAEYILLTDLFISRLIRNDLVFAGRPAALIPISDYFKTAQNTVPAFAQPSDMMKDPSALQRKISLERQSIIAHLNTVEEDALCNGYAHTILGKLTISEWIAYLVCNTDIRISQMEAIGAPEDYLQTKNQ